MQKSLILNILQKHKGEFVSGQMLCDSLGVTRTSIWKMMQSLKQDGYVIEAATKKGYRLVDDSETYNAHEIAKELLALGISLPVLFQKSVDSTNIWAFEESDRHDRILLVADEQTLGKGRRGRTWISPLGSGIWMSYLCKPDIRIENASMITLVFALSVAKAMQDLFAMDVKIKWPNDIVYQGRKICGILTEMRSDTDGIKAIVCGIGINANTTEFPAELANAATSIQNEMDVQVDRAKLIAKIMQYFDICFGKFLKTEDLSELKDDYEEILANKDNEVYIIEHDTHQKAFCKGITNRGELLVLDEDGHTLQIHSGEVSIRGIYGYV